MNLKEKTGFERLMLPKGVIAKQSLRWRQKSSYKFESSTTTYGRIGSLEVRLARRKKEINKAQRLRYKVFYKEMSAIPDVATKLKRRDIDLYDKFCDHLLLIDHDKSTKNPALIRKKRIVGTYRMLPSETAKNHGGFYTEREYNLSQLLQAKSTSHKFLELGRSCVLKPYRSKRSLEMLWHGLWTYIRENNIDVLIGCASFAGTDPKQHALALSFLHHYKRAPEEWLVKAHDHLNVNMNMMDISAIDMRKAVKAMPPLIKGYLRLGAYFGEGAVIDHQFGTIDVMVIMPVADIDKRYFTHFGAPEEKTSRITSNASLALN